MCRNFSCQVCVAHSLTHCWKSSRLDDPQVSFTCSMTEAAQTGQFALQSPKRFWINNERDYANVVARLALWNSAVAEKPRLHRRRRVVTGARHRREHGALQPG